MASRPGMAFTHIISRHLGREVLNFGFSGNCLMEHGVAQWLAQIDAAMFIIDCSWNMAPALIANRSHTAPPTPGRARRRSVRPVSRAHGQYLHLHQ